MATIRNLIIRISVSENTDKGVRRVTTSLKETNRELDSADKKTSRFDGTLSRLGRSSLTGITNGLKGLTRYTGVAAKGLLAVAAAASALNTATSLGTSLAPLVGGLLLIPAAAVAAAAALGTLHLATSGVGDAFKAAAAGDQKKFEAAIKDLAPAAKTVAGELFGLRPVLLDIRKSAQQALFAPLVGQMTALAKVLAGPVKAGAAAVASQFGQAGRQVAEFARQSKSVELVKAAFGQTQLSVMILRQALDPLLAGFRALATEGLSFLPRIATAVASIATRFGEWLQKIVASGQATQWINNFFATLKQLGGVLSNVGGILKSVFSAASAAGSGFLGVIGQALASLNQFLKTAAGKSALTSIFQGLAAIGQSLAPVIGALVQGLGQLAGPVSRLALLIGPILTDAITALAPALAELEPGLTAIFQGLGSAVTFLAPALVPLAKALAAIGIAVAPILPVVGQLAALLAQQLAASITQVTSILGPVIAAFAVALAPVLPQIAQAFADVARAMAPIATQVGQQLATALAQVLPPLLAIVPQLLNGLLPALTQLLVQMTPLIPQFIQLGVVIAQNFAQTLPQLIPPLIQLVQLMVEWSAIMVPVLGWILSISTALATALGPGVTAAVQVISTGLTAIFRVFQWLYDVLLGHSIIPDIVNGTVSWFSSLPGRVISIFTGLASGAVGKVRSLLSYLSGIPGSIRRVFSGAGSWLRGAGVAIIDGLVNGIRSAVGWLKSNLSWVTSLIPSWKGPLDVDKRLLTPSGAAIMGGLVRGITSQLPVLRSTLAGVSNQIRTGVAPVAPAGVTAASAPAGVAAAAGGGARPLVLQIQSDGSRYSELLVQEIRKAARVQGGGDVQLAFGGR